MIPNIHNAHDPATRNIINAAIDSINTQGKSIQDLVAEGQLTEEQYSRLITEINGLLKSGEVGNFDLSPELRSEVDKIQNKIDKGKVSVYDINKNKGKLDATFFSSNFLQELNEANLDVTNVLPESITARELSRASVKPEKTSFLSTKKNLFNKNDVVDGISLQVSTGNEISGAYHSLYTMSVKAGTTYVQSHQFVLCIYDKEENMLDSFAQATPHNTERSFTTPQDAAYLKTAAITADLDDYQIEIGSTSTSYEPFRITSDAIEIDSSNLIDGSVTSEKLKDNSISYKKRTHLGNFASLFIGANSNPVDVNTNERKVVLPDYIRVVVGNETFVINDDATERNINFFGTSPQQILLFNTNTQSFRCVPASNIQVVSENEVLVMSITMESLNKLRTVFTTGFEYTVNGEKNYNEVVEKGESSIFAIDDRPKNNFNTAPIEGTGSAGSGDTLNLENTTHVDVYSWYDELVNNSNGYVEKTHIRNDGLDNPINLYHFKDLDYYSRENPDDLSLPKFIIFTGVHGQEKSSTYTLYKFMEQVVNDWENDDNLEFARFNAEYIIVPCAVPSGYDANTRGNHNGVDINRNFTPNWKLVSEEAITYGGTEPLSEIEAQVIDEVLDENNDAFYVIDYHAFSQEPGNTDIFAWGSWLNEKVGNTQRNTFNRLTRKWRKDYDFIPEDPRFSIGFTIKSRGLNATLNEHATYKGLTSSTFEVCERVYLEGGYVRNNTANTMGTELIGNHIIDSLHHLSK